MVVEEGDGPSTAERLAVEVRDPDLCTRFVGRWVSGVTVGPSPDRVQMRLIAAGQRPVSNVVDASNYVMLELGKPIHTFDAGAVHAAMRSCVLATRLPGSGCVESHSGVRALPPLVRCKVLNISVISVGS